MPTIPKQMKRTLRIGTRDSALALWQAKKVQSLLENLGYTTSLVPVKSQGDLQLHIPLYAMGTTGVFTRVLDVAMLRSEIDIAVHSMKDVPTELPQGIAKGAVLPRALAHDVLVYKGDTQFLQSATATIATGSLRRRAQWLSRYPKHTLVDLRGNIQTRLHKLATHEWNGAIFAAAALERLGEQIANTMVLDWFTPAPAQGAILAVAKAEDTFALQALAQLNDPITDTETDIERRFLRHLEGGCTAPIGAKATITADTLQFIGNVFSLDGSQKAEVRKAVPLNALAHFAEQCAEELLQSGGEAIMQEIRKVMKPKA